MPEPEQPIVETSKTKNQDEFYVQYNGVGIRAKGYKGIYEIRLSKLEYDLANNVESEKPFGHSMTGVYLGDEDNVMNLAKKIRGLTQRMKGYRAFGDKEEQTVFDLLMRYTGHKTNKPVTYAGNPNEAFLKQQKEQWKEVIWLIVHKGYSREDAERELGYIK